MREKAPVETMASAMDRLSGLVRASCWAAKRARLSRVLKRLLITEREVAALLLHIAPQVQDDALIHHPFFVEDEDENTGGQVEQKQEQRREIAADRMVARLRHPIPVSYTHLTLPTT